MALYDRMRGTAGRLLHKYKQGVVDIGRSVNTPGANTWDAPVITTTWTVLDAVVQGVSQKYIDGSTILASDLQVLTQVPIAYDEVAGDMIRIDGEVVSVLRVMPIPASGDAVATRFIVR